MKDRVSTYDCLQRLSAQSSALSLDENGRVQLAGQVLLSGDLLVMDIGDWQIIGQLEYIDGQPQVTLFDSDWGRLIHTPQEMDRTPARLLATRPIWLPPFGEPFSPDSGYRDPEEEDE